MDFDEKEFFKVEAMILSMTRDERTEKCELRTQGASALPREAGRKWKMLISL